MTTLSLSQARRLAFQAASGFHRPPGRGPAAVTALVERLGFVQIDTISVVERAHHHVIGARLPGYKTEWLDRAHVFEYWAHAAAYLPWSDFRFTLPRKERVKAEGHDWLKDQTYRTAVDEVLARIWTEGPLLARDFESEQKSAGWFDWKPAKRALEYLYHAGDLMVTRQGFQKVFDLTERVLPADVDTRAPSPDEFVDWCVDRALNLWGLVARDEAAYQRREHRDKLDAAIARGEEAGALIRVGVEGTDVPYWVRPDTLSQVDGLPGPDRKVHILSPFDPFLIHRKRLNRLFGFDFTIECYVPEPKRTFGYFALPLVWGSEVVGLLDAKADRQEGVLVVKRLRYDGPGRRRAAFEAAFTVALEEFARFNGVEVRSPAGATRSD